jgi:hypothetical protein
MQNLGPLQPGCYYHIYNRGNNGEFLFREETNYEFFLHQYQKYLCPVADTFAYCLLRNHSHLLVRIGKKQSETCEVLPGKPHRSNPEPVIDPSRAFSNFFNSYAKAMNSVYGRTGSLFQERFRRKEVEGMDALKIITLYIHTNPQNHGLVKDFHTYEHSSYHVLLGNESTFLQREEVMGWFGGRSGFDELHRCETCEVLPGKPHRSI